MKLNKRNELNINDTWDLSRLFKTESSYEETLSAVLKDAHVFYDTYHSHLKTKDAVIASLEAYQVLLKNIYYLSNYQSLHISVDQTSKENIERSGKWAIKSGILSEKLAFYIPELQALDDDFLISIASSEHELYHFVKNVIIKPKKHALAPDLEQAFSQFSTVFQAPYENYEKFKLADMHFENFSVGNETFPLSFTLFENNYEYDTRHDVRRHAFKAFYETLRRYEHGLGNNYQTHVYTEKAFSNLKNFSSIFDYLLFDQDVTKDMYDRQIDVIMEKLSPIMIKYAKLIQKVHHLDTLTYADLKLSIDPEFEPKVTIAEAKDHMLKGLKVWGDDYIQMIERSFKERWIDFPQSIGKSTGGFCASPYQKGSYILLNWNDQMDETFVMAHELGHAGHFHYAGMHQNIFNTDSSLYFIEAPSTMNELMMGHYLNRQSDDPRFKRWVLSTLLSRTYYHNMVTHLLEAHYQREVYRLVDQQEPLSSHVLNQLKLKTLKQFWKDSVQIDEAYGRTWIRQPHYFMGLYPYTYSAGLTIATAVSKKILEGTLDPNAWLEVLKSGGTKTPLELAKMVGVDLSTEKPLLDTIEYIGSMVDEIIRLTEQLESKR